VIYSANQEDKFHTKYRFNCQIKGPMAKSYDKIHLIDIQFMILWRKRADRVWPFLVGK